ADAPSPSYKGTLPNTVTVSSTNTSVPPASATVTVLAPALTLTKTTSTPTVTAGQTAAFTVTLSSPSAATASATGVTLSDPLPTGAGHDIVWSLAAGTTANTFTITTSGTIDTASYSETLSLSPSPITVSPGTTLVADISGLTSAADAPSPSYTGTLPNTVTVSSTNTSVPPASATVTVLAPALTLTKTTSTPTVTAGQTAAFTVTLSSPSAATASATGVTLSDPLPTGAGHDIVWSLAAGTTANTFTITTSGTIDTASFSETLSLSPSPITVSPGTTLVADITGLTSAVDAPAPSYTGTLPNTVTVSSTNTTVPPASATVTVLAPALTLTKTTNTPTVTAGQTADFTVTLSSPAAATANATGVTLSDPLPTGAGDDIQWSLAAGTTPSTFTITTSGTIDTASFSETLSLSPSPITVSPGTTLVAQIAGVTSAAD